MKKQYLFGMMLLASISSFTSCSDSDNASEPIQGKMAIVEISIAGNASRASTRGEVGSAAENLITKYEAYTFETDGTLIEYKAIPSHGRGTLKATIGTNKIVVIANSDIKTVATYDLLKAKVGDFAFSKTSATSTTTPPAIGFEMYGEDTKAIVEGSNYATITVKRLVSKFPNPVFTGATVTIPDVDLVTLFGTGATAANTTFTYTAIALANGLDKSNVFPPSVVTWDLTGKGYLNSTFNAGNYDTDGVYSNNFIPAANFIPAGTLAGIYVHENYPAQMAYGGINGYDPLTVYCFIIKGVLTYNSVEKTRYWRINLVKNTEASGSTTDEHYCINRNGVYKITVSSINTIGWETPKEAEEEVPVIPLIGTSTVTITVVVEDWDVYVSTTEM